MFALSSRLAHWLGLYLIFHLSWVLGPFVHGRLQNLKTSENIFLLWRNPFNVLVFHPFLPLQGIVAPTWFSDVMINTVGTRETEKALQLGKLYRLVHWNDCIYESVISPQYEADPVDTPLIFPRHQNRLVGLGGSFTERVDNSAKLMAVNAELAALLYKQGQTRDIVVAIHA